MAVEVSIIARIKDSEKEILSFWINAESNIQYHKKCARCKNKCKQSFKCLDVICSKYLRR